MIELFNTELCEAGERENPEKRKIEVYIEIKKESTKKNKKASGRVEAMINTVKVKGIEK